MNKGLVYGSLVLWLLFGLLAFLSSALNPINGYVNTEFLGALTAICFVLMIVGLVIPNKEPYRPQSQYQPYEIDARFRQLEHDVNILIGDVKAIDRELEELKTRVGERS